MKKINKNLKKKKKKKKKKRRTCLLLEHAEQCHNEEQPEKLDQK